MLVDIAPDPGDDTAFIVALNGCVSRLVVERQPRLVYILRVTKWFDHKWLRYSGMGRVRFDGNAGLSGDRDTALDAIHGDRLTFPPFSPRNIASQRTWRCSEEGVYRRAYGLRHPHSRVLQSSTNNLHNRVARFADSALFIWFSSGTLSAGMVALLVYGVNAGVTEAWYSSFQRSNQWAVARTKGISRRELESAFPLRAGSA